MCSVFQRNRNFSSLLLVPMLWNVACDDAGKRMRFFLGGRGAMSTAEIHISETFLAHCDTLDKSLGFHI